MAELITNEFTVNLPIDEAWPIICDVERIAPCLPGAELQEIEGTTYRGVVKIKLGAITANFKGEAEFVERDDTAHRAKLAASGRDTGGRGNARADVTAEAESLSPTSTKCTVTAELNITGKVAQFGRGIMGDVSKKLMDQFSSNLNTMLDEERAGVADAPAPAPAPASDETPSDSSEPPSSSGVRRIEGPAAEPIDVANLAGAAVAKRAIPAVLAVIVLVLVIRRLW
ncbi:MAG: SRPBCC family protein [Actinomycetota bacterium]|nr:SRPBCC family protein [Actinomycetota bacterium]MDA2973168.1 SRPBCC family protein [Actinomycetota bacterium]MDA3009117.1 SRPBCC family protein [Actinomycetota bacterium]